MDEASIQKILDIAQPPTFDVGHYTYSRANDKVVAPPAPAAVYGTTLQGLIDLFDGQLDDVKKEGDVIFRVESPFHVEILSRMSDEYGRRRAWAVAHYPSDRVKNFPFGQWLDPEAFVIQAQASIQRVKVQNDDGSYARDLDYVLRIASNIAAEAASQSEDDGIKQTVSMRRGVVLKGQETINPRVNLAPFRSFAEIDQPLSLFIFRANLAGDSVKLALFEADGGRWQLDAMASIAAWLKARLPETVPVVC